MELRGGNGAPPFLLSYTASNLELAFANKVSLLLVLPSSGRHKN